MADINRATLHLTSAPDWRGGAGGRAHHDGEEREGVLFVCLFSERTVRVLLFKQTKSKLRVLNQFRLEGFYSTGALKENQPVGGWLSVSWKGAAAQGE